MIVGQRLGFSTREFKGRTGVLVAAGVAASAMLGLVTAVGNLTVAFYLHRPAAGLWLQPDTLGCRHETCRNRRVTVSEQKNVPETAEVEKVIKLMIELDGTRVIFATYFGY